MANKLTKTFRLFAWAFVLAYLLPFGSLLMAFGFSGLAKQAGNCKLARLGQHFYHVYTIGILPSRIYVGLAKPPDVDADGWMNFDTGGHYTAKDFTYALSTSWVTFLSWLVVLFGGSFSWRYLLGPGVSARRRVTTLWVIGVFIEVICATAALWWVTTGEPCGDLVRALVFAIPLALLLQGALLLAYAWWSRRRSGVTPKWLKALSVSTVVLGIGVVVLWAMLPELHIFVSGLPFGTVNSEAPDGWFFAKAMELDNTSISRLEIRLYLGKSKLDSDMLDHIQFYLVEIFGSVFGPQSPIHVQVFRYPYSLREMGELHPEATELPALPQENKAVANFDTVPENECGCTGAGSRAFPENFHLRAYVEIDGERPAPKFSIPPSTQLGKTLKGYSIVYEAEVWNSLETLSNSLKTLSKFGETASKRYAIRDKPFDGMYFAMIIAHEVGHQLSLLPQHKYKEDGVWGASFADCLLQLAEGKARMSDFIAGKDILFLSAIFGPSCDRFFKGVRR